MERIFIVVLLVSLCSATSPPFFGVRPLDCNETLHQTELAIDLMNKERDEGFVLRPIRIEGAFEQASHKPGGQIYYLDMDVMETDCSVLSGKSWKECQHDIPFHEAVFGHCKAIILVNRLWRILKLLNYNCTLSTVPHREVVQVCPDCPALVKEITPNIKEKANRIIEKYNKENNNTHYFKVDDIERVTTQYVFGQSYFFYLNIKETECLKTQANVNLADCKFLKDHEAHVGFCKGSTYNTPDRQEGLHVSCEIYNPRDDRDHHGHKHGWHCDHRPDNAKKEEGQVDTNVPGAGEVDVKQEGPGEAGHAPGNGDHHRHGRFPHHRGHKHHHCQHGHHHHHPHDHHHHHHHFGQQNDSHPHHDHHHNHTSSKEGSSSEEHSDHKSFHKRSKGSIQFHDLTEIENKVPVPFIFRPPPPPVHPGKRGKLDMDGKHGKSGPPDNIEFPSEPSPLSTCPGVPLLDLPELVKKHIF